MKTIRNINKRGMYENQGVEGESIETKVRRITENKEPISDGAPIVYTEKKDGVLPQYDIRTDKWDIALMAMDAVNKAKTAKSKSYGEKKEKPKKGDTAGESAEKPKKGDTAGESAEKPN